MTVYLKYFIALTWVFITFQLGYAQNKENSTGVSIGADTYPPDPSAILDIRAVNKGVLVPRLNAIPSNDGGYPDGLLIYVMNLETKGFYYYKASVSQWTRLVKSRPRYPEGAIVPYSGKLTDSDGNNLFDNDGAGIEGTAMENWHICNGNNNTPNMTKLFVVGGEMMKAPSERKVRTDVNSSEKVDYKKAKQDIIDSDLSDEEKRNAFISLLNSFVAEEVDKSPSRYEYVGYGKYDFGKASEQEKDEQDVPYKRPNNSWVMDMESLPEHSHEVKDFSDNLEYPHVHKYEEEPHSHYMETKPSKHHGGTQIPKEEKHNRDNMSIQSRPSGYFSTYVDVRNMQGVQPISVSGSTQESGEISPQPVNNQPPFYLVIYLIKTGKEQYNYKDINSPYKIVE